LGLTCTTVTNALLCTAGTVAEINLGPLGIKACHDQCEKAMISAGISGGCWMIPESGNCYCRSGSLAPSDDPSEIYFSGGSCSGG
jgi:hypothetical protein